VRISVHDDVLIGSMPEGHLSRNIEAAVDFGRALKTAYEDTLEMKYPGYVVSVQVEVKLFGGFGSGLVVEVSGYPGEVLNEPEIIQGMLERVREMTLKAWMARMHAP